MTVRAWPFWPIAASILGAGLLGLVAADAYVVKKLGGPKYLAFKIAHPGDAAGWSMGRREAFKLAPSAAGQPIVFLGDSITHQLEWAEVLGNDRVLNRGVDGDTTGLVSDRLQEVIDLRPSRVFLMIGINNLASQGVDETFADIVKIVERLEAGDGGHRVVIQSVLPVNNTVRYQRRSNENVRALNAKLRAYANERGLTYLDVYSHVADKSGDLRSDYTYDGLHLNGRAYRVWLDLVRPLVEAPRADAPSPALKAKAP